MAISYLSISTRLGELFLAATERGICFIQIAANEKDALAYLGKKYPDAACSPAVGNDRTRLLEWGNAITHYINGDSPLPELPLDIEGTEFQKRVWDYLRTIPAGSTQSYTEVAKALGIPGAARAVGTANGANPVAILIPCHRLVRSDGGLAGYRWGIQIKQTLIEMEKNTQRSE